MTLPVPGTRLERSPDNRMIAGVVGGIANYLGWNATMLRVATMLVIVISVPVTFGGTALLYLLLWALMPLGISRPR